MHRVNGLYTVLDEMGTWNASWTQVCNSIHDLASQVSCLNDSLSTSRLNCSLGDPGKKCVL